MYPRYPFRDPRKFTPEATIKISLIQPMWGYLSKHKLLSAMFIHFHILDFTKKFRVTTPLFQIEEEIRKRHGGSIGAVSMCLGNYSNDTIMHDKSKTLRDMGIAAACEAVLLYDFKPI